MYIDPFWAGVAATILAELIVFVGMAVFYGRKDKENK